MEDDLVIKAATSIMGARGRGASKARDPKKMSEPGRKAVGQRAARDENTSSHPDALPLFA
jgi:hypothetical protein